MVFHWSLSDSKSLQVSRTHLRILAVLSNAVVWIVSTRLPNSKCSRPFNNPFVIVPNAPITIGIIVTFMFHSFFNFLSRSRYLSFFFIFLQIYSVVRRDSKIDNFADSLFFVDYYFWRCPWCNGYRRRIWTQRHEFKSWTWLIAFHIALILLGKVWIQLFSLQLWVNSRAD